MQPLSVRISTARALVKKGQDTKAVRKQEAIGRSKGGLTTKIHALVDALGNPVDFIITPGQACDLEGSDAFLPNITAEAVLADKAFDADERVIKPLEQAGIKIVIPPKSNRKNPRTYDEYLYKSRHLIENFFAKLKQFRAKACPRASFNWSRGPPVTTKPPETSSPPFSSWGLHMAQLTTQPNVHARVNYY
jgi:transposase